MDKMFAFHDYKRTIINLNYFVASELIIDEEEYVFEIKLALISKEGRVDLTLSFDDIEIISDDYERLIDVLLY